MLLHFSSCHTIMLFGFVYSKQKKEEMTQATRNHECTHARQWAEVTVASGALLMVPVLAFGISAWWLLTAGLVYYLWYVVEWVFKCVENSVLGDDWDCEKRSAYRDISFEREARFAEKDPHYLENSRYFAWLGEM